MQISGNNIDNNYSVYEQQTLQKLSNFFRKKNNILFAYWYGSRNEFTDVDIAVYFMPEKCLIERLFDYDLADEITDILHKAVDVIVINNADLEMRYAIQKGLLVFERDKKKRVEFEVKTRLEYWDFLPILRLHMAVARKKLMKLFPQVYERLDSENATRSK